VLSQTRRRVYLLQLLLALTSAVILGSESHGTRDPILLSQIRDFPIRRLLRLAGLRLRYSTPPLHLQLHRVRASYFTIGGLPPISSSWRRAPWDSRPEFFSQLNTCGRIPHITSSLTRGWVCHLQLLLALASAFILGSESRGTRDPILLSPIRDFPFCRLLRLAGLRWRYSTPLPHWKFVSKPESESELLYDWRFTANKFVLAPSPLRLTARIFFFHLNTCGHSSYVTSSLTRGWICRLQLLLRYNRPRLKWPTCRLDPLCTPPSTMQIFTIAAGPRQSTHSQVQVLQGSWPYFTVSDSRLPQPGALVPIFISPRNRVAQF
jgi:hypothetical protein